MGVLKKVEIENRIQENNKEVGDFFMVDLIVDGTKIDSGREPISNHHFWKQIGEQAERAKFKIKKENPRFKHLFDGDFFNDNQKNVFINHLKDKYPNVDVDNVLSVFDSEIAKVKQTGPDDNHPNPELRFPIDSQLSQEILISVINKFGQVK